MKAFDLSKKRKGFALLMEQGTGKTKVIIDTAAYLYENKAIDTMIVICPNGVHRNWVNNEIPIHMACDYKATFYSAQMKKDQQEKKFSGQSRKQYNSLDNALSGAAAPTISGNARGCFSSPRNANCYQ